jgi:Holliday junction DNA helicase RuvA
VSIPGVGKKLAERLIVVLRDIFTTLQSRPSVAIPQNNDSQLVQDAVSALVNLGYRKAEVEKNVRDMIQTGKRTLEEVIKDVLRRMSR